MAQSERILGLLRDCALAAPLAAPPAPLPARLAAGRPGGRGLLGEAGRGGASPPASHALHAPRSGKLREQTRSQPGAEFRLLSPPGARKVTAALRALLPRSYARGWRHPGALTALRSEAVLS